MGESKDQPNDAHGRTDLNTAAAHLREGREQEESGFEERELEERGAVQRQPDRVGEDVPHSQKVSSDG